MTDQYRLDNLDNTDNPSDDPSDNPSDRLDNSNNFLNSLTSDDVISVVREYLQSSAFTDRKLTDTPTDDFAVVNRKYVTANGTFATRPAGAVTGQPYFATDLVTNGKPTFYNGTNWVDSVGSILGAGL